MLKNWLNKFLILSLMLTGFTRAQVFSEKDVEVCRSKFQLAADESLAAKPIGEVITAIGKSFIGTEYAAHTLEKGEKESLVINLTGLDCTTFLENCLVFARLIKMNDTTFEAYQKQLQFERYRDGKINEYPSRLHYFADWIYDAQKKGIVKDVSKELGGIPLKFNLDFMTTHPDYYAQLKNNPGFVPVIRKQEEEINKRRYYYIPKNSVARVENKIHTGDLIAITSNVKGLDINHVGIAVRQNDSRIHFMHAPDVGYKVQITEEPLSSYLMKFKKDTGIMVVRALEPEKK